MKEEKSAEFLTNDSDLPTKGDRMETKCSGQTVCWGPYEGDNRSKWCSCLVL